MPVLAILALTTADNGPLRLILFMLVLVAVILIMVGCVIALLTWRKRRQTHIAYKNSAQLERDRIRT